MPTPEIVPPEPHSTDPNFGKAWTYMPRWLQIILLLAVIVGGILVVIFIKGYNPEVRPPVTKADIEIVQCARKILSSPAKWNRADTRACPLEAKTFSLYCALEKATNEVTGNFKHRGAAMQEARFVIDEVAPNRNYDHRLRDYNNDPTTTFADMQNVLRLVEERITKRLTEQSKDSRK